MKPVFSTLALALTFGFGGIAGSASADDVCMPAGEMKASLVDWYGEMPVDAPQQDGQQVWASSETGTWTMIRLLADGNACVIAQGTNWMGGVTDDAQMASLTE